eukprot:1159656-Pelagomonas_calceolata.AAC.15
MACPYFTLLFILNSPQKLPQKACRLAFYTLPTHKSSTGVGDHDGVLLLGLDQSRSQDSSASAGAGCGVYKHGYCAHLHKKLSTVCSKQHTKVKCGCCRLACDQTCL